jgi:hypothetical protein
MLFIQKTFREKQKRKLFIYQTKLLNLIEF